MKQSVKSDIPSIADHISKLIHIGKASVTKLQDLRGTAMADGYEILVPDELNCIDTIGAFQKLMQLGTLNARIKDQVSHMLKLSPEKMAELSQHAMSAVVPDFRPRVWWCPAIHMGLLFACNNGSASMDFPIAVVNKGDGEDKVVPIHTLDPVLFSSIPKRRVEATQSWYAPEHPGWAIYWREGVQNPALMALLGDVPSGGVMASGNRRPETGSSAFVNATTYMPADAKSHVQTSDASQWALQDPMAI